MAANPVYIVDKRQAVQYDGTNSADIAALDPGFEFNNASESDGVWSFQSPPDATSYTVNTGDWLIFTQNYLMYRFSNTEFTVAYNCVPECP